MIKRYNVINQPFKGTIEMNSALDVYRRLKS